jgi:hypothetical protein
MEVVMKKIMAVIVASAVMGLSFTSVSFATEGASDVSKTTTTTTTTKTTATTGETSNGMSSDKPVTETTTSTESSSSGLGDTLKTYWNKFIDVFTGPSTK